MSSPKKKPLDRLTRDALAADAAGMTYGKWKALEYERRRCGQGVRPDMGETDDIPRCRRCGAALTGRQRAFCSNKCRWSYKAAKDSQAEAGNERPWPEALPVAEKSANTHVGDAAWREEYSRRWDAAVSALGAGAMAVER